MQDSAIVQLYWDRDETAISQTQSKYEPYLMKIAVNILSDREDSMESVNDTYLAAWNSMPPNRPNVLRTYLGKLTRRISIDLFRKKTGKKRGAGEYPLSLEELGDCCGTAPDPEQLVEGEALAAAIAAFLRTQPQQVQHVFVGRYYFMDPVKEIARYCQMSESNVKVLLFRTRKALQTHLVKEGFICD
jgi:RNA polymerase sigma-70 factor (ECF subfamily)